MSDLYETDFYAWSTRQAALLRSRQIAAADLDHIAEEIESMGRSEKRELINRLAVLLLHLLKWEHQPPLRGTSWRATIREQRRQIARLLDDNPSLRTQLPAVMTDAYGDALVAAERETGMPESHFPPACPWTYDTAMSGLLKE